MPKGRGSNEARRNRRLAHRQGGGNQGGQTRKQWQLMAQVNAVWRRHPDTWRMAHLGQSQRPGEVLSLWGRLVRAVKRAKWAVHTSVAPRSANRKLESMLSQRVELQMRTMPTQVVRQPQQRRQSSRRR